MKLEVLQMLWGIIEKQIGNINTTQDYYEESIKHLDDYEFICNSCLEMFIKYNKLQTSSYYSEREIGEKAHNSLVSFKEYIDYSLKMEDSKNEFISKDKIRDKIKEEMKKGWTTKEERHNQNYAVDILKELLGE